MSCGYETEKNVVEKDKCERNPNGQGSQTMGGGRYPTMCKPAKDKCSNGTADLRTTSATA